MSDQLPLITAADFKQLLLSNVPMMDMRAPLEFTKGAFPNTTSLPLMTDRERQKIGTSYKRDGKEAAIALGHQLVRGKIKQQRMALWLEFAAQHPDGVLYCFRGGLRSQTVQQWLNEAGVVVPRIEGGYKALRQFLISELERLTEKLHFVILAGHTGSAKTVVISQLSNAIDLEGLANHRGSSFGRQITPQPSQIDFENNLIIAMMRAEQAGHTTIVLEDESFLIGRCAMPHCFHEKVKQAPVVVMQKTLQQRQAQIHYEYVSAQLINFIAAIGEDDAFSAFSEFLLTSLTKIKKRLGDVRYHELTRLMTQALATHKNSSDDQEHYQWIAPLLEWYYDPMYSYQIEQKQRRVIFEGDETDAVTFLADYSVR
ncbi:MAG: tRNA 2-selenouridine(34) synthase MnmH [Gammaproteobacteria bacterium]|nr:tRNA 2-selenouridine(34) synthase MnmH [Gammaproteobacteria bacterium]